VLKAGVESVPLVPEIEIRFHLIEEGHRVVDRLFLIPGTYGLYGLVPDFIVATSRERPGFIENLGFRVE